MLSPLNAATFQELTREAASQLITAPQSEAAALMAWRYHGGALRRRHATDKTVEEIVKRLEEKKSYIPESDCVRREYAYALLREYAKYIEVAIIPGLPGAFVSLWWDIPTVVSSQ